MSNWKTFLVGIDKNTGLQKIINIENPYKVNENSIPFSDCNKTLGEILEQSCKSIVTSDEIKKLI